MSVDIEVAARRDTLELPVRSVHDLTSGQPWVLGVKDGRAAKIPVRVGIRGNSHVEIVAGLSAGDVAVPRVPAS